MSTNEQPAVAAVRAALEKMFEAVDRRYWIRVEDALANDVLLDYGKPERLTRREVVARWKSLLGGLDLTQHTIANLAINLQNDVARCRSTFRAVHFLKGALRGERWALDGSYEFEFSRQGSSWLIRRMKMIPNRSTGNGDIFEDATAMARRASPDRP